MCLCRLVPQHLGTVLVPAQVQAELLLELVALLGRGEEGFQGGLFMLADVLDRKERSAYVEGSLHGGELFFLLVVIVTAETEEQGVCVFFVPDGLDCFGL